MRLSSHLLFDLGGGGPPFLVRLVAERPDAGRRQGVRHHGRRDRRRLRGCAVCRRRHLLLRLYEGRTNERQKNDRRQS